MPIYKGTYNPGDDSQNWFKNKLPTAKETLKRFPILDSLLDSFANYEQKQFRNVQNSIMFLCLPYSDGSYRGKIQLLEILEKTLEKIKVNEWSPKDCKNFKCKISSEKVDVSYFLQTELEAFAEILSILGEDNYTEDNLTLYPKLSNGRVSDIRIVLGGRPIYIEIGNLSSSRPIEKKINSILDFCAKHLGKQVSHSHIRVEVDTAEFTFSNQDMDEPASKQQLISEIDGLKLSQLAGYEGFFSMHEILRLMQNKEAFEKIKKREKSEIQNIPFYRRRLTEITENPIAEKWISSLDLNELQKAKVIKVIIGSSKSQDVPPLVEIHSEALYPSKAVSAEIQSFIKHLTNNVRNQLSQIQPYAPNVIAVRVDKFMLTSLPLFAEIGKLQTAIGKLFDEKKDENLFGIALYHDSLKKAIFFKNPYASACSTLSNVEMANFGFHSPTIQDTKW